MAGIVALEVEAVVDLDFVARPRLPGLALVDVVVGRQPFELVANSAFVVDSSGPVALGFLLVPEPVAAKPFVVRSSVVVDAGKSQYELERFGMGNNLERTTYCLLSMLLSLLLL